VTTVLPTRTQIDNAEPLTFPTKPKQDLTITIKCRVDGFDTEICYTGDIERLLQVTQRLRAMGAEPVSRGRQNTPAETAAEIATAARKPAAKRVEPEYLSDGTTVCPVHGKELQNGRYGLYCPAKAKGDEQANDKGYCSLKFAD
jgi:hypothetical protein